MEDRRTRAPSRRLDSWKEIASYFGRDERTVKRWEKDRGLPVHRLPGARGGVYAFTDELSQWMSQRDRKYPDSAELSINKDSETALLGNVAAQPEETATQLKTETSRTPLATNLPSPSTRHSWLPVAALLVVAATTALLISQRHALASFGAREATEPKINVARHTPTPAAQDLYLQGRYYWNKRTAPSLTKALGYFQQAVAADPNYALAYVGLADCYNLLREYAAMPEDEAYRQAIAAARKAIELDPTLADAHNSLAFDLFFGTLDRAGADREFQTALRLNPNCELAHHWYATYLMTVGRAQEALQQIEIARQLNSSSSSILADKGLILYVAGRTDDAVALLKQIEKSEPAFVSSHRYLAAIDLVTGNYDEYLKESRQSALLSGNETELAIVDAAARGYRSGGQAGMLNATLEEQRKWYNKGQLPAYRVAQTYSLLGQKEQALAFLRLSRERHESALAGIMVDPAMNPLRNDPSYRQLALEAGLG
jgi:tetratricopeptide (TPR) repeat protein